MKDLKAKVAYLQGLAEGLRVDDATKEGKVLAGIIDVLGDIAGDFEDMRMAQDSLQSYVDVIDQELSDLQDEYYGLPEDFVEVQCPNCGYVFQVREQLLDSDEYIDLTCPNCGEIVFDDDDDTLLNGNNEHIHRESPLPAVQKGRVHEQHQQ